MPVKISENLSHRLREHFQRPTALVTAYGTYQHGFLEEPTFFSSLDQHKFRLLPFENIRVVNVKVPSEFIGQFGEGKIDSKPSLCYFEVADDVETSVRSLGPFF
jgi:hypothetical protein